MRMRLINGRQCGFQPRNTHWVRKGAVNRYGWAKAVCGVVNTPDSAWVFVNEGDVTCPRCAKGAAKDANSAPAPIQTEQARDSLT